MAKFTLLHISDLHLMQMVEHDQQTVLQALFDDLRQLRQKGRGIDAVLFTGDLIAKGQYNKTPSSYVLEKFIDPLMDAAGLDKSRFFSVPGNHDIETAKSDQFAEQAFATFNKYTQVNEIVDNISTRPYIFNNLVSYNVVRNEYTTAVPVLQNALFSAYNLSIGGINLGIACLNSAWRASGKANDFDYGRLLIGERQVEVLASSLSKSDIKIAMVHHPLTWLAPYEGGHVQRAIHRNFHAVFHGHNHYSDASLLTNAIGNLFISNAGCLYQSREYFNGYSIVSFVSDPSPQWIAEVREYQDARGVFDISVRYSSDGAKTYQLSPSDPLANLFPTEEYIVAVREKVDTQLLSYAASDVAPKSLHHIFVEPPLSHLSERQIDSESEKTAPQYLSLQDLARNDKAIFFVGRPESGKTTLLNYLCLQAAEFSYSGARTHAFYVDIKALERITRSSILDAAGQFSAGEYKRAEILRLLTGGKVVLCFDNFSVQNESAVRTIAAFVSEFKSCKFCFAVNEQLEQSLNDEFVPKLAVAAEVVYIHSYGRKHTRALIRKWFTESDERVRERLDAVLLSMRLLNIPQTPFLISILLWINERNVQFLPVNQAGIIDTFIDGLLGKLTESKSRSVNDATVKRHFLMEFANYLFEQRKGVVKEIELEAFTVEYFQTKGLTSSATPFLEELFSKGLLTKSGDDVFFKFECFRAFFLALKFDTSKSLVDHALTPHGFLTLKNELDYYTGLHRDKLEILAAADGLLDRAFDVVAREPFFPDLSTYERIGSQSGILTSDMRESLQKSLFGKRPSVEEQEELIGDFSGGFQLVDSSVPTQGVEPVAEVVEDVKPNLGVFFETLTLCSMILRNSELVSDVDLKREIYAKVISRWSNMLLIILMAVEKVDTKTEASKIGEIVPNIDPAIQKYFVQLALPNVMFSIMHEALGTTKLDKIIREHAEAEPFSLKKIASVFLMADLTLQPYLREIQNILQDKKCTRFTAELIFFKLLDIYMLKNISTSEAARVQSVMGDVFVFLNNRGIKLQNDALRTGFVEMLQKQEQVQKLRTPLKSKGDD